MNEFKQLNEQIRNPAPAPAGFDNTNLALAGFTNPVQPNFLNVTIFRALLWGPLQVGAPGGLSNLDPSSPSLSYATGCGDVGRCL